MALADIKGRPGDDDAPENPHYQRQEGGGPLPSMWQNLCVRVGRCLTHDGMGHLSGYDPIIKDYVMMVEVYQFADYDKEPKKKRLLSQTGGVFLERLMARKKEYLWQVCLARAKEMSNILIMAGPDIVYIPLINRGHFIAFS